MLWKIICKTAFLLLKIIIIILDGLLKVEIDLAGHPTLAAAHVVFEETAYNKNEINFHSKFGEVLTVTLKDKIYSMNFPAYVPVPENSY